MDDIMLFGNGLAAVDGLTRGLVNIETGNNGSSDDRFDPNGLIATLLIAAIVTPLIIVIVKQHNRIQRLSPPPKRK